MKFLSELEPIELFVYGILLIILLRKLFTKHRKCPFCDTKLPKFRIPRTMKQIYWGGWTCPKCKKQVNSSLLGGPKK